MEDIEKIKNKKWYLTEDGYVASSLNKKQILLHRIIMKTESGQDCDHKDGNKLDNRKYNLRNCTALENTWNQPKIRKNNKSGFTGVYFDERVGKYQVTIQVNYDRKYLGHFSDFDQAVKVRKDAEQKYWKDFAPKRY